MVICSLFTYLFCLFINNNINIPLQDNPNIWCDRPLPATALKLLSLEVMHLLALRSAMLDTMLADYTLLVDGYLNACCQGTSDVFLSTEVFNNLHNLKFKLFSFS